MEITNRTGVRWATANNPSITFINYEQQQNRKQTSNKVWRLHAQTIEQEQILTTSNHLCLVIANVDTVPNSKKIIGCLLGHCVGGIRYSEQRLQPQSSFIVASHNKLTSHNTTNRDEWVPVPFLISRFAKRNDTLHGENIRPSCIFTHQI